MSLSALARLLGGVLLLITGAGIGAASADEPPVLSYHQLIAELAAQDPTPLLRIYGDGRAVVHVPAYRRDAGTFESWLTPDELDALLTEVRGGMARQTADASARRAAPRVGDVISAVSDSVVTVIEMRTPAAAAARDSGAVGPGEIATLRRSQADLQYHARRSNDPALRALAATERRLQNLVREIAPRQQP